MTDGDDARARATAIREEGATPPPFGGSWRALHIAVVAFLAVEIALLAWLTRAFAP